MKRIEPESIATVIDKALEQTELTDVFREQSASYLWSEVVGHGVNRYTTRRYVDHGVLHVYISSGSLKGELQFMRSQIMKQINLAVGAPVLTDIQIH